MTLLEKHFDDYMNKTWNFNSCFNSHHRNVLKKAGISNWVQLIPIYEAQKFPDFIRYCHRIQVEYKGVTVTFPKKLSDSIHTHIGVYFDRAYIKPRCLACNCGMILQPFNCCAV